MKGDEPWRKEKVPPHRLSRRAIVAERAIARPVHVSARPRLAAARRPIADAVAALRLPIGRPVLSRPPAFGGRDPKFQGSTVCTEWRGLRHSRICVNTGAALKEAVSSDNESEIATNGGAACDRISGRDCQESPVLLHGVRWWRILRLLRFQLAQERGQRECQQMAIARYDVLCPGFDCAFENTVVGFIL